MVHDSDLPPALPPIHPGAVAAARVNSDIPQVDWDWANELVAKLSRRSPIRLLFNEIRSGKQSKYPMAFLESVLRHRSPKKWRERALAAWMIGAVPLDADLVQGATLLLSEVLGGKIAHDRFGKGCSRSYFIAYGICAVLLTLFTVFEEGLNPLRMASAMIGRLVASAFISVPLGLAISPVVIPTSMAKDKKRLNFILSASARTLGKMKSPHAITALTEAARDGDKTVRENSLQSLRTHLPQLTPQHYGTLNSGTVPGLCFLLNQRNRDFRLEILGALEKVGDGRALGPVTRLHAVTKDEQVKEAAYKAMVVLAERAENEKRAATLLRPINAPGDSSGILLRPAGGSFEHDETQLLRAVLADEEE